MRPSTKVPHPVWILFVLHGRGNGAHSDEALRRCRSSRVTLASFTVLSDPLQWRFIHFGTLLSRKTLRLPTKYFVVWRSDDFAWKKRVIPRSSLPDPTITNVTELDDAVEKEVGPKLEQSKATPSPIVILQMRILNVPSLSICIYRGGVRVLSVSYGYSDLRTETRVRRSGVLQ